MKKTFLLIALFIFAFTLTGCGDGTSDNLKPVKKSGEKEIVCTLKKDFEQYSISSSYTIYYEGEFVNTVYSKEEVTSSNETFLETVKSNVEATFKSASSSYGGYTYKAYIDGNKLTSEAVIVYGKMNIEKYIKDDETFASCVDSDNNVLVDKLKAIYKSGGATCNG